MESYLSSAELVPMTGKELEAYAAALGWQETFRAPWMGRAARESLWFAQALLEAELKRRGKQLALPLC